MTAPTRIGRYEVLRELGRGAMGTVYLARDSSLGRLVALKTFRPASAIPDPEDSMVLRRRMLREAQRAGTLSHPNVITIFDVVEAGGDIEGEDGAHGESFHIRMLWWFLNQSPGAALGEALGGLKWLQAIGR